MVELEEGTNVLCTVKGIDGTTVFVKLEDEDIEGTIITSEIAPGRIRNLRDYVVPGKKIVCKIIKIDSNGNLHLSLRRVTDKEKKEVMAIFEKERSAINIIKSIAKENYEKIISRIKQKNARVYDFLYKCKEDPEKLEDFFSKEESEKICKILEEKKEKQVEVKRKFKLSTRAPNGISIIKRILMPYNQDVKYLAAGRYLLTIKSEDYKHANSKVQEILRTLEKVSQEERLEFDVEKE